MEIRGVSSLVPARATVTLQSSVTATEGASAGATVPTAGSSDKTASGPVRMPPGVYISPVVHYDQAAKVAVILFRDGETGETKDQIPAEKVVEQYRRNGGPPNPFPPTAGESTASDYAQAVPGAATGTTGGAGGTAGVRGASGDGVSIGASFLAATGGGSAPGASAAPGAGAGVVGSGGSGGAWTAPATPAGGAAGGTPTGAVRVSVTV